MRWFPAVSTPHDSRTRLLTSPPVLTIIGGGACGIAALAEAVARLRMPGAPALAIRIVERDVAPARGLAFGTHQPGHLLNTESRLMGLHDHEPGHFRRWLAAREPLDPDGVAYPPRAVYRAYMRDVLDTALADARASGIEVEIVRGEVVAIGGDAGRAVLTLADGQELHSALTLLAIGTPKPDRFPDLDGTPGYFDFPWPSSRLREGIGRDQPVAILGTSLSAIDTLMTLLDEGHRGAITMASLDGLLPHVEIPRPEQPIERRHFTLAQAHRLMRERGARFRLSDLLRLFRAEAEAVAGAPIDWRAADRVGTDARAGLKADIAAAETGNEPLQRVLTSARHEATDLWNLLPLAEQKRFGRWLAPHFGVSRFTMPMVNARRVEAAFDSGILSVRGGVRETLPDDAGGFRVAFEEGEALRVPVVVNATGTAMTLEDMAEPLVAQLAGRGWLTPHAAGGAWADRATCRIDTRDPAAPRLYAVGQLLNGVVRDTNAVWFNVGCCARAIDHMLHLLAAEGE